MILTHLVMFGFFSGAGTASVGGSATGMSNLQRSGVSTGVSF